MTENIYQPDVTSEKSQWFFLVLVFSVLFLGTSCSTFRFSLHQDVDELVSNISVRECLDIDGSHVVIYKKTQHFLRVGILVTTKTQTNLLSYKKNHVIYDIYSINTRLALASGSIIRKIECPVEILKSEKKFGIAIRRNIIHRTLSNNER